MNKKKQEPPPPDPDIPCQCAEVFIHGERVPRPKWHDCTYIYWRNTHLLEVCARADSKVDGMPEATEADRERRRNARAQLISRDMDRIGHELIINPLPIKPTNAND